MDCGLFFKKFGILTLFLHLLVFQLGADESIPKAYLLPKNHSIKPFLDRLFSSSRVIHNLDTLKEAGFVYSKPRKVTKLIIATHPELPGYIFKLYLDAQRYCRNKPETFFWRLRVEGAQKVQMAIDAHHLHDYVKVPKKWIYKLPAEPKPPKGYMPKQTILVEEDMQLLSKEDNEKHWQSSEVSFAQLYAVFTVLSEAGLSDCAKPDNIPFSIDGRISFIDTQTHGEKVPYHRLNSWLSPENQDLWKKFYE